MTKAEIQKEVETQLDSLSKLIKAIDGSNFYGLEQNLKQAFEYLLAASIKSKSLPEEPAAPKLMRRSLF